MKPTATAILIFLSTTIISAQTWVRQNPFAHLSQLYDISFDGKYGLAVGADATIFTTSNFGITWVQQKPSALARTIESALVVPGTMGELMLAAGDSIIMVSKDGGDTWKVSYVEVPNLFKIQYLPGDVILAIGKDFGLWSIDDGTTWQPFNLPAFGVTAGHFVSVLEGWVALGDFDNVQIWHTSNGGFNWAVLDPQVFPLVNGIEMINDLVGFLASRDFVYKTVNGGLTWLKLHTDPVDHIQDLFVIDEDHLWTSLDNGSIYFSNNGGVTWERRDPNLINSNRTLAIWADVSGNVWTVGKYLSILHSDDFGQTWVDQIPGSKQTLFSPSFYNAFSGMVGGSDGAILKTKNSGATWLTSHLPVEENFFGTAMIDENTVIAGSSTGRVFITTDQGDTWKEIGSNLGQITDLHAFDVQQIIVTNEEGDIYKTTNGGADWVKTFDGALVLYAVTFLNAQLGWATGISGKVLMTDDGGTTWSLQWSEGMTEFSDIHFTSATEGWITSSEFIDSIWHTEDGGISWQTIALPMRSYWYGVSFMDRDTGWVVGGSNGEGLILRTEDQGVTWTLDHTSPDAFRGIYVIPNSQTAWAVGFGGNIMKFSSCTQLPSLIELKGDLDPCEGDTVNFVLDFEEVDVFTWGFPPTWSVIGNTNTASIYFIAGGTPGEVTVQGSNACGDTTNLIAAQVIPTPTPVVIIQEENGMLISNQTEGSFQWYMDGFIIPGATNPSFQPAEDGYYYLEYATPETECEGTSNILLFTITSTQDEHNDKLMVYPNPIDRFIVVRYQNGILLPADSKIVLMNMDGKHIFSTVATGEQINIPDLMPGIYSLQVRTDREIMTKKIVVK